MDFGKCTIAEKTTIGSDQVQVGIKLLLPDAGSNENDNFCKAVSKKGYGYRIQAEVKFDATKDQEANDFFELLAVFKLAAMEPFQTTNHAER